MGQTYVVYLLEQMAEEVNTNTLLPPDHHPSAIEPINPQYPQNPKDLCDDKKADWTNVSILPCGSAWGG